MGRKMGGKSIYILLYSIIVTVLVISGVGLVVGYQVLSIEREVCTEITVEFPDKVENYPLCVKLVLIFSPSNKTNSITIDIPISINLGNKTIERIVKIPMEVKGEVRSIYLKGVSIPDEENVIWVTPPTTPTPTPTPAITPTVTPMVTTVTTPGTGLIPRPTNPGTSPVSPIIVREYITTTVSLVIPITSRYNIITEILLWILIIITIIVIVYVYLIKKGEKKEEGEEQNVRINTTTSGDIDTDNNSNSVVNTNNIVLDTGDVLNLNGETRKE
ncbi:MAG: hypothetical protein QW607_10045 [Desulfurococcaceae archaeon]